MTPTVGRIVYYKDNFGQGTTHPAIITGVDNDADAKSDGFISLTVFYPTYIYNILESRQGQDPGQWDWMPYQKGQAAKTEELEAKLKQKEDSKAAAAPNWDWEAEARWQNAYESAKVARAIYRTIPEGALALQITIIPAIRRYETGERSAELLSELENIQV